MARINTIDYSRFGNENYLGFCRELLAIIGAYPVVSEKFGYLTTPFAAAVEVLDDAMKQPTWSELTEPIRQTDDKRDRVIISFKAMVESMRHYSPVEGGTADAEKVARFIKLNHVNPAAQYDKETMQVSNLLQDLEKYCADEVQCLGLQQILGELKRLNDKIAALLVERDINESLKKSEAVQTARRKLDTLYIALKDSVNAYAVIDAEGLLTPFINAVNQMIKRLNEQVLRILQSGNKPGNGETTENPENPNPESPEPENPGNPNPDNPNPDSPTPDNPENPDPNPENPNPGSGGSTGGGSTLQPDPDDDDEIPEGDDPWRTGK